LLYVEALSDSPHISLEEDPFSKVEDEGVISRNGATPFPAEPRHPDVILGKSVEFR
jgi:hypothetical protein